MRPPTPPAKEEERSAKKHALDFVTFFVAVCSFFLTFYSGCQTRRHDRLSVSPRISIEVSASEDKGFVELQIVSCGLGPARIIDSSIIVGGNQGIPLKKGLREMEKKLNSPQVPIVLENSKWIGRPYYFRAGDRITLARFAILDYEATKTKDPEVAKRAFAQLKQQIKRYGLRIQYGSFYEMEPAQSAVAQFEGSFWDSVEL